MSVAFHRLSTFSFSALVGVLACACSSGPTEAPRLAASPIDAGDAAAPAVAVDPCADVTCPDDQTCRDGTCLEPTERQRAQADSVSKLVENLSQNSAWHESVDAEAVERRERAAILKGDGEDVTYLAAAWRVMNAFPQGHQAMYAGASVCASTIPLQSTSRFGVCGRPAPDGLIVTFARDKNALGLSPGDVIVGAGAERGQALLEASYLRPVCGDIYPSKAGRLASGAASFFAHVPANMVLSVRAPDGTTREVTVPASADKTPTECFDPFGRNRKIIAEATTRPDGVAVIRLPSFFPYDKAMPTAATEEEFAAFIDAYRARVLAVFEQVKNAPAIIWDTRGNGGGITMIGLEIAGGFASARATNVSYCQTRIPGSSPPRFDPVRYAKYDVTPGGPFAYAGKVAVVTDGLAYSAGDYFPLVVMRASDAPVIGTSSAGAFGGGRAPIELGGPPKLSCNYDPTACFAAADDAPLEGAPPAPTIAAEYDPNDLAAGKDTIIERAVKALGF